MGTGHGSRSQSRSKPTREVRFVVALAVMLFWRDSPSSAQTQGGCGTSGYRIVSQSWDAVLKRGWEWRQECNHPAWPLRLVAIESAGEIRSSQGAVAGEKKLLAIAPEKILSPVLVNAGGVVQLWMQDQAVRIEMSGVVERSARQGEQVVVQVTRQDDEAGLTVQRISGRVSGANAVEIER